MEKTPFPVKTDLVDPDLTFVSIVAGAAHACALTQEGVAYCWGDNSSGQLGALASNGQKPANSSTPLKVWGNVKFTSLATRYNTTCGLDPDGNAWCWGSNDKGQILFGGNIQEFDSKPMPVASKPGPWISLATGSGHTCGIRKGGKAECWGSDAFGKLGSYAFIASKPTTPKGHADYAFSINFKKRLWKSIYSGGETTGGIDEYDHAYCMGHNIWYDQLDATTFKPRMIRDAAGNDITFKSLALGGTRHGKIDPPDFGVGITLNGTVLSWGDNTYGQLGYPTLGYGQGSATPVEVNIPSD
jgi:alpha-tubulin suppressor-like RCC1 family protein